MNRKNGQIKTCFFVGLSCVQSTLKWARLILVPKYSISKVHISSSLENTSLPKKKTSLRVRMIY